MPHRLIATLTLFLLAACGSGGAGSGRRPAEIPIPDMDVRLTHDVFFGSQSEAPATIEVAVANRAQVPITLRRVEVSSPGMVSFAIRSTQREFGERIGPGETKTVTVFATAVTSVRRPTEPLTIQAILTFESAAGNWREVIRTR